MDLHQGLMDCLLNMKDLVSKSAFSQGKKLLKNITELVNFMLNGKFNSDVLKYLYGAIMCPSNKKDNRVRPIAISCVFRRLTGKICSKAVQDTSKNYFQPIQLGFATKQGFESVMHATHTFIEQEN